MLPKFTAIIGFLTASVSANYACTVTENNVNFRAGPGTNFKSYGQVNRGQNLEYIWYENGWVHGNLWGGRADVWIANKFLKCP